MISILLGIIIIILVILFDQVTKAVAVIMLEPHVPHWVIKDVFSFTLTYNQGAAFSSFSGQFWFLMLITLIASVIFFFMFKKVNFKKAPVYSIGISFIIGGMYGNMIDRVYSHFTNGQGVIDMLSFDLINFAIFNVADAFLVIGIILLIIDILFLESRREKNGKPLSK